MDLPPHPEADDPPAGNDEVPAGTRTTRLVVALLGALVAVILILHLTGVMGPAGN
jgi:hypothetical protein